LGDSRFRVLIHVQRKQISIPVVQQEIYYGFVLFRVIGAGGIEQFTMRSKEVEPPEENLFLQIRELGPGPPYLVRCISAGLSKPAFCRTGHVGQHSIKSRLQRELLGLIGSDQGIDNAQSIQGMPQKNVPAWIEFICHNESRVPHELGQMGGFAPGSSAQVQHIGLLGW
jgi:hypothetical protein